MGKTSYSGYGNSSSSSSGIGFCGALCIAFIVMKLCGVINWSWGWILAPLWIPLAILLVILLCFGVYCAVEAVIKHKRKR